MVLSKALNCVYDLIAIILSIITTIFEVIIIYDLYQYNLNHRNRLHLLFASIISLSVIHSVYIICAAFIFWTRDSNKFKCKKIFINLSILLLISPFIPIIIHLTIQNPQSLLSKYINKYFKGYLRVEEVVPKQELISDHDHFWNQWQYLKIVYHSPFLLQFILQTLPQFIIQTIILSYNYNNTTGYINHLFIALSLGIISFMFKIIPFCGFSFSSFSVIFILFDYCCIVTDFLLLFITISTIYISSVVSNIFYFKITYIISILYVWSLLGLLHDGLKQVYEDMTYPKWKKILITTWISLTLTIPIIWLFPIFIITIEMASFSWIWLIFVATFRTRIIFSNGQNLGQTYASHLWNQLYQFINNCISDDDMVLRLCTVNYTLIEHCEPVRNAVGTLANNESLPNNYGALFDDDQYLSYFETQKVDLYQNVTLKSFHDSNIFGKCSNVMYYIWNEIYLHPLNWYKQRCDVSWNDYNSSSVPSLFLYLKWGVIHGQEIIYWQLFAYILGPYYVLSRLLNVFCAFYILCQYIVGKNNLLFDHVFIKLILIAFWMLFCGMMVFGIICVKRCYHIEWNILPGFNAGTEIDFNEVNDKYNEAMMHKILRHYNELIDIPKREQFIIDAFGDNCGGIIIAYIGRFTYESITSHCFEDVWGQ